MIFITWQNHLHILCERNCHQLILLMFLFVPSIIVYIILLFIYFFLVFVASLVGIVFYTLPKLWIEHCCTLYTLRNQSTRFYVIRQQKTGKIFLCSCLHQYFPTSTKLNSSMNIQKKTIFIRICIYETTCAFLNESRKVANRNSSFNNEPCCCVHNDAR